ncbi:MAG TPA: CpsB/CapC family capsule biosynthesis tyrosine phosphatase [Solirubrobacteraceae bacterium]|nr:CpsB/CapC family capsule biosynthesis tyrosine phosphatase [Solirubrobacteraceae bacterium]
MIDLHCHLLPGIDDGPATMAESLLLAQAAVADGTGTMVATPHVNERYPNSADSIRALVTSLEGALAAAALQLEIRPGAEIAMTVAAGLPDETLAGLTLGGGGWLLLEPPFVLVSPALEGVVADVMDRGFRVVVAHPERCPVFLRDRSQLERMVEAGAGTAVTAGALDGRFGRDVRRFALKLAGDGLMHCVTSDAHDDRRRPPTVSKEVERAGLGHLARWLTEEVPSAILAGAEIPPRPSEADERSARRGRRWLRS